MKEIYALTDYKNQFGSKWKSHPYRSGYDKELLINIFNKYGYEVIFMRMQDVNFKDNWLNRIVIYTSSEEKNFLYKSFIEDIVLGLESAGAKVIPRFNFLRANNNKVYMEILRDQLLGETFSGNSSLLYGTIDELMFDIERGRINYPCVIKTSTGAMSRGIFRCDTKNQLIRNAKKITKIHNYFGQLKESVRIIKHKGYKKESRYQKKFILQKFVPGLHNDWKILVYGDHYYVLNRGIRKGDFRASGSHFNYKSGSESKFPLHLLDKVEQIFKKLDVPHLSLDFATDGSNTFIHEFQAIYFGTSTLELSDEYYIKRVKNWSVEKKQFCQEEEYVWGIIKYLENNILSI